MTQEVTIGMVLPCEGHTTSIPQLGSCRHCCSRTVETLLLWRCRACPVMGALRGWSGHSSNAQHNRFNLPNPSSRGPCSPALQPMGRGRCAGSSGS